MFVLVKNSYQGDTKNGEMGPSVCQKLSVTKQQLTLLNIPEG
jgi:hypothetical protein